MSDGPHWDGDFELRLTELVRVLLARVPRPLRQVREDIVQEAVLDVLLRLQGHAVHRAVVQALEILKMLMRSEPLKPSNQYTPSDWHRNPGGLMRQKLRDGTQAAGSTRMGSRVRRSGRGKYFRSIEGGKHTTTWVFPVKCELFFYPNLSWMNRSGNEAEERLLFLYEKQHTAVQRLGEALIPSVGISIATGDSDKEATAAAVKNSAITTDELTDALKKINDNFQQAFDKDTDHGRKR